MSQQVYNVGNGNFKKKMKVEGLVVSYVHALYGDVPKIFLMGKC